MEILLGILLAAIGLSVHRARKGPQPRAVDAGDGAGSGDSSMTRSMGYTTEVWATPLAPLCAVHGIPLAFALSAIEEESGGNPCAIGAPGAVGPDGFPREQGIYQFYNPDDFTLLGLKSGSLRAYCNPQKVQVRDKHGNLVWSHSQEVIRRLTDEEMLEQATATTQKILASFQEASKWAKAAGVTWPSDGKDFWRLVKLVHGLPGLLHAIVAVAKHLGRPPGSWSEYRTQIETGAVKADDKTEAYRAQYASIFDNAEKATAAMEGEALA